MRTLVNRIGCTFLAAALISMLGGMVGLHWITSLSNDVTTLLGRDMVGTLAISRAQAQLLQMRHGVTALLAANPVDPDAIRAMTDKGLGEYAGALMEIRNISQRGASEADGLQPGFDAVRGATRRVVQAVVSADIARARDLLVSDFAPLVESQTVQTRDLIAADWIVLDAGRVTALAGVVDRNPMLVTAAAIPPFFAVLAAVWIWSWGLRRPLRRLVEASEFLKIGDYSNPVMDADRRDEVGVIATALERLRHEAVRLAQFERQARAHETDMEASRLRDVTDAAFEGIAICDSDKLTEANTSLAAMLGVSQADLTGRSIHTMLRAEDGTYLDFLLEHADGKPVTGLIMADSGPRPAKIHVRRVAGRDGETRTIITVRNLNEQKLAEERIRYLAFHDPLTGLGNRAMLRERLEHAIALSRRSKERTAVLCIDIDHFKAVNSLYGRIVGDALLKEVARRLAGIVRETDAVVRLGSDEFAILQGSFVPENGASLLAARVIAGLAQPFDLGDGRKGSVTASIGIAVHPDDATEAKDLIAAAEAALDQVSSANHGTYAFFQPEQDAELRLRGTMESDLKKALAGHQFTLAYQPQGDTATGEILGFEALLRWTHPVNGAIAPEKFIPIAEQCGAITDIGAWVLRAACAEAASWDVPLRIAINVSPIQIEQREFAMLVETTLAETGLDPSRLEIEVTETGAIRDAALTGGMMHSLKALGVSVAIDDFGTGISSLATLRDFAFDRVKVDRSFVSGMCEDERAAGVVRSVISLGHALGIPVLAEGVETAAERALLLAEGCDEVQGYLIGKPLPIDSFAFITHPSERPRALVAAA